MRNVIPHPDACTTCGAFPPYATFQPNRRQCDRCRKFFLAGWFQRKKRSKHFKVRRAAYMRSWRAANRDHYNSYARRYRLANARPSAVTGVIRLLYRVICSGCGACAESTAHRESAAAKDFRDQGWSKTVKRGWICAPCVQERRTADVR